MRTFGCRRSTNANCGVADAFRDEYDARPLRVAPAGSKRGDALQDRVAAVSDAHDFRGRTGGEAKPFALGDDAGEKVGVLGAEQADEVMKRAEVIPQTPGGRAAIWSDRSQLVADRDDALVDPRKLGARRHTHDVVLLDRSDQLRGDGSGLVRSRRLRRDLAEQRRDVLRLAVDAAFSGKMGSSGIVGSPWFSEGY